MDRLINIETDWTEPPTNNCRLIELHNYWKESRGKYSRPSRGDLRPAGMMRILRYVFLVDV